MPVDYSFTITTSDLVQGALNHPGKVRVDRIYSLSQSVALKKFGRVNPQVLDRIRSMLRDLIAKKP
jgi:mRNA interferase MazF